MRSHYIYGIIMKGHRDMKIKKLFSTVVLFAAMLTTLTSCASGGQHSLEQKLQETLDREIQKSGARGVSAAVIFPDREIWTGVSGFSHDTVLMEPDMLFAIGSITKNVVAANILKLAEEGALSLDDPLSEWLPAYAHVDSAITIRQLLNHTSGIYMFWENQKIWDDLKEDRTKVWTPAEILSYIQEPYFAPGEGWRYSNTNYLLLAMIIESASGSKLSSEFEKHFWQPLDIKNAYLSLEEDIPDHQAHVHGDNFNDDGSDIDLTFLPRASHESITYGSSGLFMSAEDLARWCHALFEGEVLQAQSMDEMLQLVDIGSGPKKRGYGLGVELFVKRLASGERAIGHSGANIGTTTYMVYLPEHHVSVAVMINAFPNDSAEVITKGLITEVLKELDVIGIIPYFDPLGYVMIGSTIILVRGLILRIKRKQKVKQGDG